MNIQALEMLSNVPMQEKASVAKNTGNGFREIFEEITGGKIAGEIRDSYDVTLNVSNTTAFQQMLNEYDFRGTNHVIIAPEALSKMESDPVLKKGVLSRIEEFCSPNSQKEISALSPPVKSAGMIIYPDGSTLYWLEGYPNETGNEKNKKAVNEISIGKLLQKYSGTDYQMIEDNLESVLPIMVTDSVSKR